MPIGLRDLVPEGPSEHLSEVLGGEPGWTNVAGIGSAIGVILIAVFTYAGAWNRVERPALLAVLLVLAVTPFIVQCIRDFSAGWLAFWVLLPLAIQHLGGTALGVLEPGGHDQTSLLIIVWLVGETASVGRRRDVLLVTIAGFGITLGRDLVDTRYSSAAIWAVGVWIALLAGLFIRSLTIALFQSKVAQAALAEQATTAERQRIAREVHDVIAHSLTVTMLHLTAARLAVGRGDSAAATEALEEAERAGRTSLNEIRHTVGLLRVDGEPESAPQPAAVDVPALVDGYRAAGLDVVLDLHGNLDSIDPAAGLALYRIVQESLTNAGRHAPGAHTTVRIEAGPPLRVDVRSEGGSPAPTRGHGLGLAGMAERATALGGMFEAGQNGNGWHVAATLP